jgi:uncharacterized protein with von Willebrand factor type A (vWA) domain
MSNLPEFLEQVPFPEPEFVDNPEPRCPCVLLLDTSGSMNDERQSRGALACATTVARFAGRTFAQAD